MASDTHVRASALRVDQDDGDERASGVAEGVLQGVGDSLHAISVLGVRLANDYGAGYSSLGYLGRLPVGAIKLDRAFTSDLDGRGPNDAIVASTIELAHRLGLVVVAEGVESAGVLDTLRGYGCDSAQGFGICQPADAETITGWLTHQVRPLTPRPLG